MRSRGRQAEASIGPVGHLFASPSVARVLAVFLQDPNARLTLSDVRERAGKRAKGTAQASLRTLMASGLVRREGRGSKTSYTYAADRELGQRMLALIEASRREAAEPVSTIPWLEGLMRANPRVAVSRPFGARVEAIPSDKATERILAAAERVKESEQERTRPGLRTRR